MIHAKNYKTVFKSVKVMPRIIVACFLPDTNGVMLVITARVVIVRYLISN